VLVLAGAAHGQQNPIFLCAGSTEERTFDGVHPIGEILNSRITETVRPFGRRMNGDVVLGGSIDVSAAAVVPMPAYNPDCPLALNHPAFATIEFDLVATQPFDLTWMIYSSADLQITGPGVSVNATAQETATPGGSAVVNGHYDFPSAFDTAEPMRMEPGEYHIFARGRWNYWDRLSPQVRMSFAPVPVPEPATWLAALTAFATIAAAAFRRRNMARKSHRLRTEKPVGAAIAKTLRKVYVR
jgi:hypothetical protein